VDPPGIIDLAAGKSARIPLDSIGDFWRMTWTPEDQVIGEVWQSSLWKFTSEKPL